MRPQITDLSLFLAALIWVFAPTTVRAQSEDGVVLTLPRLEEPGTRGVSPGLTLNPAGSIDISALGFASVGGATFDDVTGSLWICDATSRTNDLVELNPTTGTVLSRFDASIIPDLALGPDGLAIHPGTGNLFVFSPFLESEAGEVTQGGVFVRSFPSSHGAGGAAFDAQGHLFIVDEDNGTIRRIDTVAGTVEEEIFPIDFTSRLAAADFDPVTGHLFAYASETMELVEINVTTGEVLSGTDMAPFLSSTTFPTGLSFDADGSTLYFASGSDAEKIQVIDTGRTIFTDGFESGDMSRWSGIIPARAHTQSADHPYRPSI